MSSEFNCHTDAAYRTLDEIEHLISAFESCTLPRERWNHHAHLTVGLWYLVRHEKREATEMIRRNIQKYNRAHGIVTTNSFAAALHGISFKFDVVARF